MNCQTWDLICRNPASIRPQCHALVHVISVSIHSEQPVYKASMTNQTGSKSHQTESCKTGSAILSSNHSPMWRLTNTKLHRGDGPSSSGNYLERWCWRPEFASRTEFRGTPLRLTNPHLLGGSSVKYDVGRDEAPCVAGDS